MFFSKKAWSFRGNFRGNFRGKFSHIIPVGLWWRLHNLEIKLFSACSCSLRNQRGRCGALRYPARRKNEMDRTWYGLNSPLKSIFVAVVELVYNTTYQISYRSKILRFKLWGHFTRLKIMPLRIKNRWLWTTDFHFVVFSTILGW